MRFVLVIFLMLFFLSSCVKKRTIVITATNAATGERYPGLEYSVVSSRVGAVNGEGTKTVASGVLNENGEAIVELREKRSRRYVVRVVEPANTCYNKQINMFFDSPFDENGHFNFEFAECAYFKLNINNVNCQGPTDYFKLYYMGRQVGGQGSGIVGSVSKEGGGCYSFLASDFSPVPRGKFYWKWEVTRNGITNVYYDTVILGSGEYKIYDINY